MSANDKIYKPVLDALKNADWNITDDPLILKIGRRIVKADLGAERLIAATRNQQKIAVEIKSFLGPSAFSEFEKALGQYMVYTGFLLQLEPERNVYLAVSDVTYLTLFQESAFEMLLQHYKIRLIVVNIETKEIVQWID